jgi:uncharacterized protein (TIGR03435 family)
MKVLSCFLFVVVATSTSLAQSDSSPQTAKSFEVATVRQTPPDKVTDTVWSPPGIGRFEAHSASLEFLLHMAFGLDEDEMAGKPKWIDSEHYDVVAKPESGVALSREELKPLLQDLLRQRFHLEAHYETRDAPGYVLLVAKGGPNLEATRGDKPPGYRVYVGPGKLKGLNWSMAYLATMLQTSAGLPVIDKTGIAGSYDIDLQFAPDLATDTPLPTLFTALREKLGLELKSQKIPVQFLVIDHVDRVPAEN